MAIFDKNTVKQAFWAIVIFFMILVGVNLYSKWDDWSLFGGDKDTIIANQKTRISELEGTVTDLQKSLGDLKELHEVFKGVSEKDIKLIVELYKGKAKIDKDAANSIDSIDNIPDDPVLMSSAPVANELALDVNETIVSPARPIAKKAITVASVKPTHQPKSEKVSAAVIDVLWADYCINQTSKECGA